MQLWFTSWHSRTAEAQCQADSTACGFQSMQHKARHCGRVLPQPSAIAHNPCPSCIVSAQRTALAAAPACQAFFKPPSSASHTCCSASALWEARAPVGPSDEGQAVPPQRVRPGLASPSSAPPPPAATAADAVAHNAPLCLAAGPPPLLTVHAVAAPHNAASPPLNAAAASAAEVAPAAAPAAAPPAAGRD